LKELIDFQIAADKLFALAKKKDRFLETMVTRLSDTTMPDRRSLDTITYNGVKLGRLGNCPFVSIHGATRYYEQSTEAGQHIGDLLNRIHAEPDTRPDPYRLAGTMERSPYRTSLWTRGLGPAESYWNLESGALIIMDGTETIFLYKRNEKPECVKKADTISYQSMLRLLQTIRQEAHDQPVLTKRLV